jgi:26S proteasome regulatory subunit (ATPase 3-interacting protein)
MIPARSCWLGRSAELARTRSAPSDAELADLLTSACERQATLLESLTPLRAGAKALSADELKALDQSWDKWRGEWVHRRRVYNKYILSRPRNGVDVC